MPPHPDKFLATTVGLFPDGTAALLVIPGDNGAVSTHFDGLRETDPNQAMLVLASARLAIERQVASVICATAEQIRAEHGEPSETGDEEADPEPSLEERLFAHFEEIVGEVRAKTQDATRAVLATPAALVCQCETPDGKEFIVGGRMVTLCRRCRSPVRAAGRLRQA